MTPFDNDKVNNCLFSSSAGVGCNDSVCELVVFYNNRRYTFKSAILAYFLKVSSM